MSGASVVENSEEIDIEDEASEEGFGISTDMLAEFVCGRMLAPEDSKFDV